MTRDEARAELERIATEAPYQRDRVQAIRLLREMWAEEEVDPQTRVAEPVRESRSSPLDGPHQRCRSLQWVPLSRECREDHLESGLEAANRSKGQQPYAVHRPPSGLSDRSQSTAAPARALQAGGRLFEPGTAHLHASRLYHVPATAVEPVPAAAAYSVSLPEFEYLP